MTVIPTLFAVSFLVFFMVHLLPGDPVLVILGGTDATPEQIVELRRQLGLDLPIHEQYINWLSKALNGDLGRSIYTNRPVLESILQQLPATLILAFASLAAATIIGITMGTIAAVRHKTWLDTVAMFISATGVSVPNFWLGLLLLFLFSFTLGWVPATGTGGFNRLILPALTLGFMYAAITARLVRSGLLEVMREDYIKTARAKGLIERSVVLKHALKNSLIPVVTIVGLQFGNAVANTVIIETVFARQGIGRLTIAAILDKDFPMIQGTMLLMSLLYVFANILADVSYAYLDPRIRYE